VCLCVSVLFVKQQRMEENIGRVLCSITLTRSVSCYLSMTQPALATSKFGCLSNNNEWRKTYTHKDGRKKRRGGGGGGGRGTLDAFLDRFTAALASPHTSHIEGVLRLVLRATVGIGAESVCACVFVCVCVCV